MVLLLGIDRGLILMTAQRWKSERSLYETLQMNDRIIWDIPGTNSSHDTAFSKVFVVFLSC